MGTPYAFQQEFDCEGGATENIALRVPARGIIRAIKIKQISGTAVTASAAIYSICEAAPPGGAACDYPGYAYIDDKDLYRITPDLVVASPAGLVAFNLAYMYQNRDGKSTNLQKLLYMAFTPGGTGDKSWAVSMEIENCELNS